MKSLEHQVGMLSDEELLVKKEECSSLLIKVLNAEICEEAITATKEYVDKVFKIIIKEISARNEN